MSGYLKVDAVVKTSAVSIVTIATGVATITENHHAIAAETSTTDDLDTITPSFGFTSTYVMITLLADTGDTITLKHGTGNITFADSADHNITATTPISLITNDGGTNWYGLKGVGASGDIPWAAPGTIGSTTPNTGTFTQLTVNDAAADLDSRFEGVNDANLLYLDAGANRGGIGTATPGSRMDIVGRADEVTFAVRGFTAQTANIYEVYDNAGNLAFLLNGANARPSLSYYSSGTNDIVSGLVLNRFTTGTAAAGIGETLLWQIEDAGGTGRAAARVDASLNVATAGSWQGEVALRVYNSGGPRDVIRGYAPASGAGVLLGFYDGSTPVAKQTITGSRGGNAALASLLTALAALNLVTDSSSA